VQWLGSYSEWHLAAISGNERAKRKVMSKARVARPAALECTAYHEAGHAVACFALKRRLLTISIVEDKKECRLGEVRMGALPRWVPQLDEGANLNYRARLWLEREAMILFAGGIAERKFRGRHDHVGAHHDRHRALDYVDCLCGSTRESEAYVAWLYERTVNLLDHPLHWPMVECLARELLAEQELRGRKLREAIARAQDGARDWIAGTPKGTGQ
jgi:hypothetical protein